MIACKQILLLITLADIMSSSNMVEQLLHKTLVDVYMAGTLFY